MRINLIGGPGVGKSTAAASIYGELAREGFDIALVEENIKIKAYLQQPYSCDSEQTLITMTQMMWEEVPLISGIDHIITGSPVLFGCFYAWHNGNKNWPEMVSMSKKFDAKYPVSNFLLSRGDLKYQEEGRFETEKEAKSIDTQLRGFLKHVYKVEPPTYNVVADNRSIVEDIKRTLKGEEINTASRDDFSIIRDIEVAGLRKET